MAQLSNDCFAFGGELMRAEEALGILAARVSVIAAPEAIALADACGRILTEDLSAARNVPPHDTMRRSTATPSISTTSIALLGPR